MTLRELLGDGPADVEITGLAFDNRARRARARCSSACPASPATGTTSRPTPWRAAPRRSSSRGRSGSACPRCWCEDVRAAMARAAARFYGDPTRAAARGRRHGDQRQDDDGVPRPRRCSRRPGVPSGLLGTVTSVVGGRGARRSCARRRRRSTSSARSARCSTAATRACAMEVSSHALELRRADGIHCRGRGRSPTSPRTTSTSTRRWRTTSWPSGGCSRAARPGVRIVNADDAYGRRLADEFPGRVTFGDRRRTPTYRALDVRSGARGHRRSRASRRTATFDVAHAAAGALQRAERARRAGRRARARRRRRTRRRGAARPPGACPGRFEPVDEGQPFAVLVDYAHKPDSLENVLRAARELGVGARDRACSARAATATAASGR